MERESSFAVEDGSLTTTDEALMLACRDGSSSAFEELFGRYRQAIWGYFRRRLPDPARAEELAQDTFVAVLQNATRYEPTALFRTYLYAIAFNLLSAERRRSGRHAGESLNGRTPAALSLATDTSLWIRQAIGRLDDGDREVLMLREFEELAYGEIAEVLQVPLGTVRSRLFRARMELRRLLTPDAAEERRQQ